MGRVANGCDGVGRDRMGSTMSHDRFVYVGPPRPLPWAVDAACRDEPTDIWYPTRRGPVAVDWTRPRSICQSCPVVAD